MSSSECGEHQKLKFSIDLGTILFSRGLVSQPEPLSVPPDSPSAPSWANRTTARCFANRARKELGWAPDVRLEDVFEAEIVDILKTVQSEFEGQ